MGNATPAKFSAVPVLFRGFRAQYQAIIKIVIYYEAKLLVMFIRVVHFLVLSPPLCKVTFPSISRHK